MQTAEYSQEITGYSLRHTWSLTTSADVSGVLEGDAGTTSTDGDDTFTATHLTYDAGDVLIGGAGNDVLNIAATANNAEVPDTVSGIENINFNATSFTSLVFDADNIVGADTTFTLTNNQAGGATGATIDNLGTGATVVAGTGVTGVLTVTGDASTAFTTTIDRGTASTLNVNVEGTGGTDTATIAATGTVALETNNGAQVENFVLSGNGAAAKYVVATGDAPAKFTLSGDQNVTLSGSEVDFDGETVVDSTTAGTTTLEITTGGASDLSKAKVDLIDLNETTAGAGAAYTLAALRRFKWVMDKAG